MKVSIQLAQQKDLGRRFFVSRGPASFTMKGSRSFLAWYISRTSVMVMFETRMPFLGST